MIFLSAIAGAALVGVVWGIIKIARITNKKD